MFEDKKRISRARSPSDDQEYLSDSVWANIESVESLYPGEAESLKKQPSQHYKNAPGTCSAVISPGNSSNRDKLLT